MDFWNRHPTEEVLERYLFRSLPHADVEQLEEHLLVCHTCVEAAEQLLGFVESLRNTLEDSEPKAYAASGYSAMDD